MTIQIVTPPVESAATSGITNEKQLRTEAANKFLRQIASCGRRFFLHKGLVSHFELDDRGRVWFVDAYTSSRIYTQRTDTAWKGFSEGGTLRDLVIELSRHIQTGAPVRGLGPWPQWYCAGDLWGYGEDMEIIRSLARLLGLLPTVTPAQV